LFGFFFPKTQGTMSYFITAISNGGGAPEQTYRKLQSAGACPEAPFAGTTTMIENFAKIDPFHTSLLCGDLNPTRRVRLSK
jgi:hypothetical protein